MKIALTFLLILLSQLVSAQDAKPIEFRNISGRIVTSDNRSAQKYLVMYYPMELGSFTDETGIFDVNVPIGIPVLLKISDGNKLVFFYKVNPEDKSIAIKLDAKMSSTSKVLLAEWDKDKAKNELLARSIMTTADTRISCGNREGLRMKVTMILSLHPPRFNAL